jgi:hypothetical protein
MRFKIEDVFREGLTATVWMTQGDGTAHRVDFFGVEAKLLDTVHIHRGEGLVDLSHASNGKPPCLTDSPRRCQRLQSVGQYAARLLE